MAPFVVFGCAPPSQPPNPQPPGPAVTAPSNLNYAAKTLTLTVGVAMTPDTDTVTGSSVTYSVTPALPTGLTLDRFSGTISGTATATASTANYVITAANSAGSTTATISIGVVIPAPSNLVYSPSLVNDTLGTTMQPDTPTVTGTVSSFTIAPTLPAGLTLNATSGAISGTPAAYSPAAVYTVTAANSSGSTTAQITLAVNAGGKVLLEQGHGASILAIRATATRVLSEDTSGHWVLWDYSSSNELASGDGAITGTGVGSGTADVNQIALAGQLAAVATSSQLQLYSATDGHLVFSVPTPSWWKLAADGSYLCAGTAAELTAWSPTGDVTFTRQGDYHAANAFAAAGQIQLAGGPSGANVIETDTFPGGSSSTSGAFSGTFYAWFVDGAHFITNVDSTVWVYSAAGVQQGLMTLPSIQNLTGQDNWVWSTALASPNEVLNVYPIGSTTPAATYSFDGIPTFIASGATIGVLGNGTADVTVVDLSSTAPGRTDYSISQLAYLNAFGAASASQWITGNRHGVLVDGASLSSQTRYFGYGAVLGITTTPTVTAVSTASGKLFVFDPSTATQTGVIDTFAGKVRLSADGTVLAAAGQALDAQYVPDRSLTIYSLPSATVTQTIPYTLTYSPIPFLNDFSLSASGTVLGQVLLSLDGSSTDTSSRTITQVSDGSLIWTDTGSLTPILLSPDGTLSATATTGGLASSLVTNIYQNGSLVTAVPGTAEGWIDNGHLLVANFTQLPTDTNPDYTGYSILSPNGAVLSTVNVSEPSNALPAFYSPFNPQYSDFPMQLDFPTQGSVYDPTTNSIYSLTNGQPVWQGPVSNPVITQLGSAAGSVVVYEAGHQVVAATVP